MVNDSLEKIFHVLYGDGDTITLLQSDNTLDNVCWDIAPVSIKGPIPTLAALEDATSGWSNVNTIN